MLPVHLRFADPREMQDSDEFLRLLLDFLDAELRAAATGVPLHKALMMQAMPKKLQRWPSRVLQRTETAADSAQVEANGQQVCNEAGASQSVGETGSEEREASGCDTSVERAPPGFAELPTLFSVFFEGIADECADAAL